MFKDYCDHGVVPAADGNGMVLACPPEVGASIYMVNSMRSVLVDSPDNTPVVVLAKPRDGRRSNGLYGFATGLRCCTVCSRAGCLLTRLTHFIPQDPGLVADLFWPRRTPGAAGGG